MSGAAFAFEIGRRRAILFKPPEARFVAARIQAPSETIGGPMSADIILFVPRSNHKAERAFWKGRELTPIEVMACELMDVIPRAEGLAEEKDQA